MVLLLCVVLVAFHCGRALVLCSQCCQLCQLWPCAFAVVLLYRQQSDVELWLCLSSATVCSGLYGGSVASCGRCGSVVPVWW